MRQQRAVGLAAWSASRRRPWRTPVDRREDGELTTVERVDQVDLRVDFPDTAATSVLSSGLFDAAVATGSAPCRRPSRSRWHGLGVVRAAGADQAGHGRVGGLVLDGAELLEELDLSAPAVLLAVRAAAGRDAQHERAAALRTVRCGSSGGSLHRCRSVVGASVRSSDPDACTDQSFSSRSGHGDVHAVPGRAPFGRADPGLALGCTRRVGRPALERVGAGRGIPLPHPLAPGVLAARRPAGPPATPRRRRAPRPSRCPGSGPRPSGDGDLSRGSLAKEPGTSIRDDVLIGALGVPRGGPVGSSPANRVTLRSTTHFVAET